MFKVGDRIKLNNANIGYARGEIATVVGISDREFVEVRFDKENNRFFMHKWHYTHFSLAEPELNLPEWF